MTKAKTVKKLIDSFKLSSSEADLFLRDNQARFNLKINNDSFIFNDGSVFHLKEKKFEEASKNYLIGIVFDECYLVYERKCHFF